MSNVVTSLRINNNNIADMLTFSRFILTLYLLGIIILDKQYISLDTFYLIILIAWITDILDGPFARSNPNPTHLYDYDKIFDFTLAFSVHMYLVFSGFIHNIFALYLTIILILTILQLSISKGNSIFLSMIYIASVYAFILDNVLCFCIKNIYICYNYS